MRKPAKIAAKRRSAPSSGFPEIPRLLPVFSQRFSQRSDGAVAQHAAFVERDARRLAEALADGFVRPRAPFEAETRKLLTQALGRTKPKLNAGGISKVAAALEGVVATAALLHAGHELPDSTVRDLVVKAQKRAGLFLESLQAIRAACTGDLVATALLEHRLTPEQLDQMSDDVARLGAALDDALPDARAAHAPRGAGRAPGVAPGLTNWFAAEVGRVLEAHGVRPSQYRDGVYADVLGVLWPAVFDIEPPGDMKYLLKAASAHRRARPFREQTADIPAAETRGQGAQRDRLKAINAKAAALRVAAKSKGGIRRRPPDGMLVGAAGRNRGDNSPKKS
jgi:hypothetical protein